MMRHSSCVVEKIELDKLSCTSRGYTVFLFCFVLFCFFFKSRVRKSNVRLGSVAQIFLCEYDWFDCRTQSNSIHGLGSIEIYFDWVRVATPGILSVGSRE